MRKGRSSPWAVGTIAFLALTLGLAGCSYADTQPDTVAVHQNGSILIPTDRTLAEDCIETSRSQYLGMGDEAFFYPAGQRTYAFASDKGADHPPFEITTSDNQRMTVSGVLTFFLNTGCEVLKKFHTEVGRKNWAGQPAFIAQDDDDPFTGWDAMLDVVLGQPLQATLSANSQQYKTLDLYKSEATRSRLEQAVVTTLPTAVNKTTGGDYFVRYTLTIQRPIPPKSTIEALEREANATEQKKAVIRENETAKEQYRTIAECIKMGISEEQCVLVFGMNSGKVQVLPFGTPVLPTAPASCLDLPGAPGVLRADREGVLAILQRRGPVDRDPRGDRVVIRAG